MRKSKAYWKDIWHSFQQSKGRVLSIVLLMALGSFTLIGLKVTAPNMRVTGEHFFAQRQTADLFVLSDYGLNQSDKDLLQSLGKGAKIEYGYFKDVVLKGEDRAFRIFSMPNEISTYDVVEGKLPTQTDEIALSAFYQKDYQIGDHIQFTEKENSQGKKVLKTSRFTITGFVYSSEILSRINQGPSTAGSGELSGYAIVPEETFDSDVSMVARIVYEDVRGLSPYSSRYQDKIQKKKQELQSLLNQQPQKRLAVIQADGQKEINQGRKALGDAKQKLVDGQKQLTTAQEQIVQGESQLREGQSQAQAASNRLAKAQNQLAIGENQLITANQELQTARSQLDSKWQELASSKKTLDTAAGQLQQAESTLATKKEELEEAHGQLDLARQEIATKEAELSAAKSQLDTHAAELTKVEEALNQANLQLQAGYEALATSKADLEQRLAQLQAVGIDPASVTDVVNAQTGIAQKEKELAAQQERYNQQLASYQAVKESLDSKWSDYQAGQDQLSQAKGTLASQDKVYQEGLQRYQEGVGQLAEKKASYEAGLTRYQQAYQLLSSKEEQYQQALNDYQHGRLTYTDNLAKFQEGQADLASGLATLENKTAELEAAKQTFSEKSAEFQAKKAEAQTQIATNEEKLTAAQETLNHLSLPTYHVYTRREVPGSEGYIAFENNLSIIDAIGTIFPVFLYLIAALVTFTTMTRFVDEERLKSGTLRALGYDKKDVMRKFLIYGAVTGLVGTGIGTLLGHYLLPSIIYHTYSKNLVLAPLELHFYPVMTLIAIGLSLVSAVLPAYLVTRRELSEKPAQLLLPKPPVSGSTIFLERIRPLWSRLSFTKKVTARNIFRYKQRMMMTILGVSGSVALLFAGLGVREAIEDLSTRQFSQIIHYDMIVADKDYLKDAEMVQRNTLLDDEKIDKHLSVHYEEVTKTAGKDKDTQSITLIAVDAAKEADFRQYIHLRERKSQTDLSLDHEGAIISEKLSQLLKVNIGDRITLQEANGKDVTVTIAGISEMYMSHFIFMSDSYYEQVFKQAASSNATMLILKNDSIKETEKMAAKFMKLSSTKGVVQNVSLKRQVHTIVGSLNRVMMILIVVSILLAVVILYNLTNINVAERIRELSTIKVLGFHNQEVTLYIYRESIYLSLLGILVGFGLGFGLYQYMLVLIPPATVLFNPATSWGIYALPAVVIGVILLALGLFVNHWLKRVNMLEALKSVE